MRRVSALSAVKDDDGAKVAVKEEPFFLFSFFMLFGFLLFVLAFDFWQVRGTERGASVSETSVVLVGAVLGRRVCGMSGKSGVDRRWLRYA